MSHDSQNLPFNVIKYKFKGFSVIVSMHSIYRQEMWGQRQGDNMQQMSPDRLKHFSLHGTGFDPKAQYFQSSR